VTGLQEKLVTIQTESSQVRQITKTVILLALGFYFIYMILGGSITNYINPDWAWLSWIAAGLCLLLGGVSCYALIREREEQRQGDMSAVGGGHLHDHGHHDEHEHAQRGHKHTSVSWSVLGVLLVPLVLGLGVPSKALGASSLSNNTGSAASLMEKSGAAHDDPIRWNIWDWQRTYNANVHPNDWFNGRQADVTGFVYHPDGVGPDQFVLARYVMRHCAADAFGVGLLVVWPGGDKLPTDTWVRLQGSMLIDKFEGTETLLMVPQTLDNKIGPPDRPYIYPTFYVIPK
jgi:putative membrane protein